MALSTEVKYLPWYEPQGQLVRCPECFAVVMSHDELDHTLWHRRAEPKCC